LKGRVLAKAWRGAAAALLLALPLFGLGAVAEEQKPADAAAPSGPGTPPAVEIKIHYLTKAYDEPPPLSLVDPILTDNGLQGARRAIRIEIPVQREKTERARALELVGGTS
jgi:hypothetical protein